jgi:hypothetical protein
VVTASALGTLVRDVCGRRLAEKEALVREGLRAAEAEPTAELSTPAHALAVHPPASPVRAVLTPSRVRRGALAAWLAAAALVGASALPLLDAIRDERQSEPLPPPPVAAKPPTFTASTVARAPSPGEARSVEPRPPAESLARPEPSPATVEPPRRKGSSRGADNARAARPAPTRARQKASLLLGCDPPTFVDAAGIRHFKKDCL